MYSDRKVLLLPKSVFRRGSLYVKKKYTISKVYLLKMNLCFTGELHQDIVCLKVKNLELIATQEEAKVANEKLSIEISRLRQQLRDRDRLLETATDSSRSRATRLHVIIRDLRFVKDITAIYILELKCIRLISYYCLFWFEFLVKLTWNNYLVIQGCFVKNCFFLFNLGNSMQVLYPCTSKSAW